LLEGLNLHVGSVRALRSRIVRARWLEAALLAVHLTAFVAAPFLVLNPWQALAFIAVHQAVWGLYMSCSFAPNHKGMPPLAPAEEQDYLRRQVLTSRNVRGGRFVDLVLGGLNYQIEHQLFPSMPRPNLRRAQPLVVAFCAERGIRYTETRWPGARGGKGGPRGCRSWPPRCRPEAHTSRAVLVQTCDALVP
jgi:fatty acid desaturase